MRCTTATTIHTSTREPRMAASWVVAMLIMVATLAVALASPQVATAATTQPNFPRLAVWWPNNDTQPAAARANCDWIALQSHDADHIAELRAANPAITILGTTNSREINYVLNDYNNSQNVALRSVSTDWMLTQVYGLDAVEVHLCNELFVNLGIGVAYAGEARVCQHHTEAEGGTGLVLLDDADMPVRAAALEQDGEVQP